MNIRCAFKTSLFLSAILVAAIAAPAQTLNTLNTSTASWGPLVQGTDGNLYGEAYAGGPEAYGSVFKVTPDGAVSTVHNFVDKAGGNYPTGLALGLNGNLYGTTKQGGASGAPCPTPVAGCGTIFELSAAGAISVLHNFTGPDGMYPVGGLTLGPDGNFYGTTYGTIQKGATGAIYGSVFKITPSGTFTSLHTFDISDGEWPTSPLVLGADGRLYGTTSYGGADSASGTVFAITTAGALTTLYSFDSSGGTGSGRPAVPAGALVQAADQNFYGVTTFGGEQCGGDNGTIYYVSPGGHTFDELFDFGKVCDRYANPRSGLVLGSDGNFYGSSGNSDGEGATLFEITPAADLTTLYTFGFEADPFGSGINGINLMQDTNGTFYGTITPYNDNNSPQVFSLSTGLGPFITTVPQMRGTGSKVLILGQGLTGTTSVTFNGVVAEFTVDSDTEITATVAAGATKGIVKVVTPGGTLSTTVVFYIP
jgi:uncharacterized repeat protein (TIGR03803 family)